MTMFTRALSIIASLETVTFNDSVLYRENTGFLKHELNKRNMCSYYDLFLSCGGAGHACSAAL